VRKWNNRGKKQENNEMPKTMCSSELGCRLSCHFVLLPCVGNECERLR